MLEKYAEVKHIIWTENKTAAAHKAAMWVYVRGKTHYSSLVLKALHECASDFMYKSAPKLVHSAEKMKGIKLC